MNAKEIAQQIREEKLDSNSLQLFFPKLIKSLLIDLRNDIKIRDISVPHMIINTGDDTIWLLEKGQDSSIEPLNISNECNVYNIIPRCIVNVGSMDLLTDQLSSPYVTGSFQYEYENSLQTFFAEFRRLPIKLQIHLKYYMDSFTDALELMQQICTKLAFIRTFKFVYLGQTIIASYKIPDSYEDQHMTEISGSTTEDRNRTIDLDIELESFIPIFANKTVHEATHIAHPISKTHIKGDETIVRNTTSGSGYRGYGARKH